MKGSEKDPLHQSELTATISKIHYNPRGPNTIWAKTIYGTAFHNAMHDIAERARQGQSIKMTKPFRQYFNDALRQSRQDGRFIVYTRKDHIANNRTKRHEELVRQGTKTVSKILQLIRFDKLDIIGSELSFKFYFEPANIWLAGTVDLMLNIPVRTQQRKHIPKPSDFYGDQTFRLGAQTTQTLLSAESRKDAETHFSYIPEIYDTITDRQNVSLPMPSKTSIPCLWDWKTGTKPIDLKQTVQHHIYSLAGLYGLWTSKAQYNSREHKLDFSNVSAHDYFYIDAFPPFYYILAGLIKTTRWNAPFCELQYAFGSNSLKNQRLDSEKILLDTIKSSGLTPTR